MIIIFSKSISPDLIYSFSLDVIKLCELKNLRKDYSYEGGFNLPLTKEWFDKELINKKYLQYHDSRQLRFKADSTGNIVGLRFKDDINYWTEYELKILKDCIEEVLKFEIYRNNWNVSAGSSLYYGENA